MGGNGGGAALGDVGRRAFGDLDVHVGGVQREVALGRIQTDVGEDGDGVAAFDNALHMTQGFKKGSPLDDEFHIS